MTQRIVKCSPYVKENPRAVGRPPWLVPQLCEAYAWPSKLNRGEGVIAIVELGGGWIARDMVQFFVSINQPTPSITDISVDGTQNSRQVPKNDADVEVALDIQVAAAAFYLATGKPATIRVYWAQDIAPAVQKAAEDGCDVCSISWGADEATWGKAACEQMEAAAEAATKAGMIVFAAAGDNDSSDGGPTASNVDCPASCPWVACGGTRKTSTVETVWNDNPGQSNGEGTGGGYSSVFGLQSFQVGAPAAPAKESGVRSPGRGRMVPDVAANADPDTGYQILVYGETQVVGGTSAVAPLYAGLFASFGRKLGFVSPKLWENKAAFNDITVGSNGEFSAKVGPDPVSGLGSPIGSKLAALF